MIGNEIIFLTYVGVITLALLLALAIGVEALCALIAMMWVLANLFVIKSINLFGFEATASDALAVGAILGLNLIQEYFGKTKARTSIRISFLALGLYTIFSILHILYAPSSSDTMHGHFCTILTPMPKILFASCMVYLVVQYLDYYLYNKLIKIFKGRFFIVRNYLSVGFTQLVDTVLFSFLALYGSVDNIGHIILISYSIKLLTIAVSTPFLALSRLLITSKR
jgi:queuosine precursor transporter